jgi:HSP20 family protein
MILTLAHPVRRHRGLLGSDFDRMFNDFFAPLAEGQEVSTRLVTPAIDVRENETGYTIKTELPGVKPEEVEVELHDRQLSIRGHREYEKEEEKEGGKYTRKEMWSGEFIRTLELPSEVDADSINAAMKDGILTVSIPRAKSSMPKKVTVATE